MQRDTWEFEDTGEGELWESDQQSVYSTMYAALQHR